MTTTSPPMRRLVTGYGLLDGGRWYPEFGLVFSDMTGGGVFHIPGPGATPRLLIPHRKGIGGLVAHQRGGFVVCGRIVAHKQAGGATIVLLEMAEDEVFFNDLGVDNEGRIVVGSVAVNPLTPAATGKASSALGRLYRIELDGRVTVLFEDVEVSNGIASGPGGSPIYHVDTGRRVVWAIEADRRPFRREAFAETSEYAGEPDGLAVAGDGSVWVAIAGGGLVVAWDRDGRRLCEIEVPQQLVTSVCFGGVDLASLFVLTGPSRPEEEDGSIYVATAPAPGLPGPRARVSVSTMPFPAGTA